MSRNAALLIDLENFYLARENTAEVGTHEPYDFIRDLERLCGFARELVGDTRRLIVSRAYADFSASRLNDDVEIGRPRREYFLRSVPTVLMDQGIEPVQVFRFPGGGRGASKNAADMRLAMDAISLIANVDFFILVTGDKDFIPVVLELRQRGAFVVGLGAHGSIARTLTAYCDEFHEFEALVEADDGPVEESSRAEGSIMAAPAERPHSIPVVLELRQRGAFVVGLGAHGSIARTLTAYCDEFHEFEALVAADERGGVDDRAFDEVKQALRELLTDRGRLHFARVKPLLDERLGRPVDLAALSSETMGDFLRDHAQSLGVVVSRAAHDWEIELPRGDAAAPAATPEARPHTIGLYRRLLLQPGKLRLHIHDYRVWRATTDHVYAAATNPDGTPTVVFHHDLRSSVIDQFADEGLQHVGKTTNDALFLIFKAGCFVCADPGPRYGQPDFNWSHYSARLAPDISSADELRYRAYAFAIDRLSERLHDYDGQRPQAELVAGMLFGPEPEEAELAMARQLVGDDGGPDDAGEDATVAAASS